MSSIYGLYERLLGEYGTQGWWPFLDTSYHKDDYSYPQNSKQLFEIYLGVVLTQNATFKSVVQSLENLKSLDALSPIKVLDLDEHILKEAIKPSKYYNQKALYLQNVAHFFIAQNGKTPSRADLLSIKGIGEESSDSILLYGYNEPQMIIDTYTKRIFTHFGFVGEGAKYRDLKGLIEAEFSKKLSGKDLVIAYQEFHALLVEHAKRFYSRKPYGCSIHAEFV